MTTPISESTSTEVSPTSSARRAANSDLTTSQGRTSIADSVVEKIAGIAARDVLGVYELGGGAGTARAFSAIRERIPGSTQAVGQGVSVEVGETEAAVDLDVVVEFGVAIADVAQAIRRNVITSVERMTGLRVTEVNVSVNDIHLPSDDDDQQQDEPSRVQ
jgi:uncharacterized alkaline shock family protein YloU